MSQEGYDNLVAELHELESVELPKVREAIAEARDKGDLSENFEYQCTGTSAQPYQFQAESACQRTRHRHVETQRQQSATAQQGRDDQHNDKQEDGLYHRQRP